MTSCEVQDRLRALGNPQAAAFAARYFKTGPGQYGEGDVFLGLRARVMHLLAKEYHSLGLDQVIELLRSAIHEDRLLALMIMVRQAAKADRELRKRIYDLYLAHTQFINNWDLVDASAPHLVGAFLVHERDDRT